MCVHVKKNQKKLWYIHYLLGLLNNPTKFKHNRIRTYNFQLKLFDIAVSLKCGQFTESGMSK